MDEHRGPFRPHPALSTPRLKICGLRHPDQAAAVASLGVAAIGVIAVPGSPRCLSASQRRRVFTAVEAVRPDCLRVLVVADPPQKDLQALQPCHGHGVVQLHGNESPELCRRLRQENDVKVWKALRIRHPRDLAIALAYAPVVDAVLVDAWDPVQRGGTGRRIPVEWLERFRPPVPWWLAGGITPAVLPEVLQRLRPDGIDVSSGVETSPGEKDLRQVSALLEVLKGT